MKVLLYAVAALLSFALALVGLMAYSGSLNKEGLDKLLGHKPPAAPAAPAEPGADDLSATAKALKEREEELDAREDELKLQQQRLEDTQSQMEELRGTLQELIAQLTESADLRDANEEARLKAVADSLAGMKPQQAALALEQWPPSQAAQLLLLVEDRVRGKILDGVNQDKAAEILKAMAERESALSPQGSATAKP
ncbi:MAG: hypothetical protein IT364_04840 [Candidatus Hydrogenedentes bacterium]|nr:hypothetical protein [Candidatus Hydrogenedentota bacterium]